MGTAFYNGKKILFLSLHYKASYTSPPGHTDTPRFQRAWNQLRGVLSLFPFVLVLFILHFTLPFALGGFLFPRASLYLLYSKALETYMFVMPTSETIGLHSISLLNEYYRQNHIPCFVFYFNLEEFRVAE